MGTTTATEVLTASAGTRVTRAQARDLATLARALGRIGDPGAPDLLEFAKACETAARGRPAARPKTKKPYVKAAPRPAFDDRPLHDLDRSYWGVMRPSMAPTLAKRAGMGEDAVDDEGDGQAGRPRPEIPARDWDGDVDARRVLGAVLAYISWPSPRACRPCPSGIAAGHSRGAFLGRLLGPVREEELAARAPACRHRYYDKRTGTMARADYDALDIAAELEGAAMATQVEYGASFVDDGGQVLQGRARGKRVNGSRRDRRNLKPGGKRRACSYKRVRRIQARMRFEEAVRNRGPSEGQLSKAMEAAKKWGG